MNPNLGSLSVFCIIKKDKINQEILGESREMRQGYKELLSKFDSLTLQMEKERLENRDLKEQIGVFKIGFTIVRKL